MIIHSQSIVAQGEELVPKLALYPMKKTEAGEEEPPFIILVVASMKKPLTLVATRCRFVLDEDHQLVEGTLLRPDLADPASEFLMAEHIVANLNTMMGLGSNISVIFVRSEFKDSILNINIIRKHFIVAECI